MFNKSPLPSYLSLFLKIGRSILLALLFSVVIVSSAKAWDIWLVTNQNRIIVIRNVETSPTQVFIVTHAFVPGSALGDFGDIGFAPDGSLYGISMGYGNGGDASLSVINLSDGSLTPVGTPFSFEWGNALAFDVSTGRGYVGGGLESYSPYEHLKRFRYFDNYNSGTETIWRDMSGDYPTGGFAGDFAFANSKAYAIWGTQHWVGGTWINRHFLLEITLDDNKNFVSYVNLGQTEPLIGEGIWGLASDGQTLYATSPSALYRVDITGGSASYTKIMDYALNANETVNGATSIWTDLELSHTVDNFSPQQNTQITLTTTIHNQGPYDAGGIIAKITFPTGYEYISNTPSAGSYNPATGEWKLSNLAIGDTETLKITVIVRQTGSLESRAEIIYAEQGDPDSHPRSSYTIDDISDGLQDDDEGSATVNSSEPYSPTPMPEPPSLEAELLPATGFPHGEVTRVDFGLSAAKYTSTGLELVIPKLDIQIPIVGVPQTESGWDVTWLGESAGYLAGSTFPTWAGNTVLTGHVWDAYNRPGPFAKLKTLRYGDQVQIHAWGLTYTYEVRESKLVSNKNIDLILKSEDYDWVTLLTCEFYNPFNGEYLFRRAVRAVLVSVK